jgi:hypothetical protein
MSADHVTSEGWRLEVRAFVDPVPRLYIWTREVNREGFTGCVVNGVAYYASAHLSLDPDKGRKFDSHSHLHMSRAEWRGKTDDWTWPARRKLEARLIAFAEEYAKSNSEAFEVARQEHHEPR